MIKVTFAQVNKEGKASVESVNQYITGFPFDALRIH